MRDADLDRAITRSLDRREQLGLSRHVTSGPAFDLWVDVLRDAAIEHAKQVTR